MGSQQQFCLRWNNHQSNMLTVFDNLFQNEALVDVTLACEGLSLKAHKMVLSACSPFFQSLFIDNPCKHPIVILKDVRFTDLKALVDFMYKGEVNVSQDQLNRLLKTAETLKVRGLAEVTSGYCIEENGNGIGAGGGVPSAVPSTPNDQGQQQQQVVPPVVQQQQQAPPPSQQQQQQTFENRNSRSPPPQPQMSPPRKRKKTKHRSRGVSAAAAAVAAAASAAATEKPTSHSDQDESDNPDVLEPKVFAGGTGSTPTSNSRPMQSGTTTTTTTTTQNQNSGIMPASTSTPTCTTSPERPLSDQSPSLQNASQVYVSPGQDASQMSGEYSTSPSLSYKRPKGGRPTILYEEEEEEIVQLVERKAAEGNPVDIRKILDYGNKLLRREGRRPTGSMYMYCSETVKGLSIKWWRGFKKRHPGLPYTRQKNLCADDSATAAAAVSGGGGGAGGGGGGGGGAGGAGTS